MVSARRSYRYLRATPPVDLAPGQSFPLVEGVRATLLERAMPAQASGEPIGHEALADVPRQFRRPQYPPIYCIHVEEGVLVGQRTILSGDHFLDDVSLLLDAEDDRAANRAALFPIEFRGIAGLAAVGDTLEVEDGPVEPMGRQAMLAGSTESINFGSWIFRLMPKLAVRGSARFRAAFPQHLGRVMAPAAMAWQADLLRRAAGDSAEIVAQDISRRYRVEDAVLVSLPVRNGAFRPELIEGLRKLGGEVPVGSGRGTMIYMSRRKWSLQRSTRVLLNEDAVEEGLERLGFAIVHPENNGFEENVRVFRGADVVVGPSGAGMFNAVFCRPGTVIIELEQSIRWRSTHANLYRSAGLRFGFIDNREPAPPEERRVHYDYRTDVGRLLRVLADLQPPARPSTSQFRI